MAKIDPLALGRDERQRLVADLQAWFQDERGERIGELAAELLIDFFQVSAGKAWYNRGVQDAQAVLRDRLERLIDDVDLLRR